MGVSCPYANRRLYCRNIASVLLVFVQGFNVFSHSMVYMLLPMPLGFMGVDSECFWPPIRLACMVSTAFTAHFFTSPARPLVRFYAYQLYGTPHPLHWIYNVLALAGRLRFERSIIRFGRISTSHDATYPFTRWYYGCYLFFSRRQIYLMNYIIISLCTTSLTTSYMMV